MGMPLTHYLKDFTAPPSQPSLAPDLEFGATGDADAFDMDFMSPPEVEPVDIEAERKQAYAEGYEAAERVLREEFDAERVQLETAHAMALSQLETRLRQEAASLFGEQFEALGPAISMAVSEQVAVALAPLFEEEVAAKAVSDLAALLIAALASGEAATITIRGPRALFDALCNHMPEQSDMRHIEADDLDLQAEINETVLVTRISAFAASMKKVLG